MPSNTVYFEPRNDCADMQDGLQASIHDPLWMLARQWQFGETRADDAGSPAIAYLQSEAAPLSRYRSGGTVNGQAQAYNSANLPLETLVEREPIDEDGVRSLALRIEAGIQFLRLLTAHGAQTARTAYRDAYRLVLPPAEELAQWDARSQHQIEIMAGRVPNATQLHADLSAALGPLGERAGGTLPAQPVIAEADRPKVLAAARAWLKWFAEQGYSVPTAEEVSQPSWSASRMEYAFAVGARTSQAEIVLEAPEYHEGHLDWYSFLLQSSGGLGAPATVHKQTVRMIPAPVTYRGMPVDRFWEFEDARVNLGALEARPNDLARLLLVEFALIYGNDWFVTPLEVDVGSLARVAGIVVADTFGQRTRIRHYSAVDGPNGPWRMFSITPDRRGGTNPAHQDDLFLMPPALGTSLQSAPIEDVLLLRDEMANMAWAVERVVQGPTGERLQRYESYQELRTRAEQQAAEQTTAQTNGQPSAMLVYRLGTTVPDYWIPLVPEMGDTSSMNAAMRLRRGALPQVENGVGRSLRALGQILEPQRPLTVQNEEVPREGARVTRAYQYARWVDGSTYVWIGRLKRPGRGEGSSGLRFDIVEPGTGTNGSDDGGPVSGEAIFDTSTFDGQDLLG